MENINQIQKKILYLNIIYIFVFLIGVALAFYGFTLSDDEDHKFIIVESFGIPMVTGALAYWAAETRRYLKIRHDQIKREQPEK